MGPKIQQTPMPTPVAPPPPPNPPMFGSNTSGGQRQRKQAQQNSGFGGTILGTGGQASTSQKTLLGQ